MSIKFKTKIWLHTIITIAILATAPCGFANNSNQDQTNRVEFAGVRNINHSPFYKDLHIKDPDTRGALSAAWLYSMWLQQQPIAQETHIDNRDWLKETLELFLSPGTNPPERARLVSQLQHLKDHYWNLEKVPENTMTGLKGSVVKEYSLAAKLTQEQLVILLKTDNFIQEQRLVLLFSDNNITALFKHGESYYFFNPDPNVATETHTNSIEALAKVIFDPSLLSNHQSKHNLFETKDKHLILGFQIFSFDPTAAEYPDQQDILDNIKSVLGPDSTLDYNSADNKAALAMSARIGCSRSLAYFLETVDNPNFLDYEGSTPLIQAIEKKHCTIAKTLLENSADPHLEQNDGLRPIMVAINNADCACLEMLLQNGANPNLGISTTITSGLKLVFGTTPLVAAARKNNPEIIKILLMYGADPSHTNDNFINPITAAANCAECLQILIDSGSKPNQADELGHNALMIAASVGNPDSIKILLNEKGVNPNCQTSTTGSTPLTLLNNAAPLKKDILQGGDLKKAAENKQTTCIKELINAGAKPNLKDKAKGWTPLMYAAENGFLASMQTLLAQGADPKIKAWKYKIIPYRAIDIAKKEGHQDCVDLLKQYEQNTTPPPRKNITRDEL